jgi:hypothetical protein
MGAALSDKRTDSSGVDAAVVISTLPGTTLEEDEAEAEAEADLELRRR